MLNTTTSGDYNEKGKENTYYGASWKREDYSS